MSAPHEQAGWRLAGHPAALASVQAAILNDRVPHAWLITGPEGVGRTTLALDLAAALNCDASLKCSPCRECPSCLRIASRSHPDVIVADMAWQAEMVRQPGGDRSRVRQRFSIDAIRALRADIVTRPVLGRWKVQILDDAGAFSDDAPEAFLKTLEEPPPFAVIILVATSPEQVRETVRSRCRHIALGLVSRSDIDAELVRRGAERERAQQLARVARGRIAWAIDALSTPDLLIKRRESVESAFEHMLTLGRAAIAGTIAAGHAQKRDATYALLELWIGLWRDALYLRAGLANTTSYPEVSDRLTAWSNSFTYAELRRAMLSTRRCVQDLDANVQARIALQAMVAQWPGQ